MKCIYYYLLIIIFKTIYPEEGLLKVPVLEVSTEKACDIPRKAALREHRIVLNNAPRHDDPILSMHDTAVTSHTRAMHQKADLSNDDTLLLEPIAKHPLSHDDTTILKALEGLPAHNKPKCMRAAMERIKKGNAIWVRLHHNQAYEAITNNSDPTSVEQQTLQRVFNANHTDLWNMIRDNHALQKMAHDQNIPFTATAITSPEYNMYFRTAYIRQVVPVSHIDEFMQQYEDAMINLQWHLYAKTILQGEQAFTSGMITMNDAPHFTVFKFLDGYAEMISPTYKLHAGLSYHSVTTPIAYARKSSHWTGQKSFNDNNFGIDFFNRNRLPNPVLPGNKSHMLFGLRTNGMVFIKWEEYGVTMNVKHSDYSALKHTVRYFEKKDKQDSQLERRESIPAYVTAEFKRLCPKALSRKTKADIKTYGISKMLEVLEMDAPEHVVTFETYLTKHLMLKKDSLYHRKGNEVVLPDFRSDLDML